MNELNQTPAQLPESPVDRPMSLPGRLLNIFADPGEVFEQVKAAPNSTANWLAPMLIAMVMTIVSSILVFSQPAITQGMHEQQAKAFDEQVKAGKMSQADADKALEMVEKFTGPTWMKIFGSVFGSIGNFTRLFWWAFLLWLISRTLLQSRVSYVKLLEMVGLAFMVISLGMLVGTLLTVFLGKLTVPGPALLISNFDMTKKAHLFVGILNVFTLWFLGLLALGLARLSGKPFVRTLVIIGGVWLVWDALLILIGLGPWVL